MKNMRGETLAILLIATFACSLAALPARADEWSKTYTLAGKPELRVDTTDARTFTFQPGIKTQLRPG
jgi:hypothetical protein